MAQVYGALLLLAGYYAAALLALVISPDLTSIPDIARNCYASGLPDGLCQWAATEVSAQSLIAIGMAIVVTVGFTQKVLRRGVVQPAAVEPFKSSREIVMILLLFAVTVVLVVHNLRHPPAGLGGNHYRPAEAVVVSAENLAWPLLLQLVFWTRQVYRKFLLAAFLAAIAAISPFRAAFFSIFYFGILIPITVGLTSATLIPRTKILGAAATVTLIVLAGLLVLIQTSQRLEITRFGTKSIDMRVNLDGRQLTSRAFTPFFQAVLVDRLARSQAPLPDLVATVKGKFHLGSQNLNQFAYEILYGGHGGQTTPLYYGESIANTRLPPLFWEFAAPLALVLLYFFLRPICDVGVLVSIAIWRSSMGGLFDVMTALALQIGVCLFLTYLAGSSRGNVLREAASYDVA